MILKNKFLILNLTALAVFGMYEAERKIIVLPPVYIYVKVPTPGMKASEYEQGCLGALTQVAIVNAKNQQKLREKAE